MSAIGATLAIAGTAAAGYMAYKSAEEQSKAAGEASDTQERIAMENLALQKFLAQQQRSDFAPWRAVGEQALNDLWSKIQSGDFEMEEFTFEAPDLYDDPGYQFRMQEGLKALDRSASSRGRLLSGAQQKALANYSQGLASQEYQNAFARQYAQQADQYARNRAEKDRQYNMLSALSGMGQASAAQQAGATGQLAATSGNILGNLGNAQAQAAYAQGDAWSNMYSNLGNIMSNAAMGAGQAYYGSK